MRTRKDLDQTMTRIILFTITWLFCLGDKGFSETEKQPNWQQSQSIEVQLGIRDKDGSLKDYRALFVITNPEGEQVQEEISVSEDTWGYVYFPEDFSIYEKPGKYIWECVVDGNVVTGGAFEYKTVETHCDEAKIFRDEAFFSGPRSTIKQK